MTLSSSSPLSAHLITRRSASTQSTGELLANWCVVYGFPPPDIEAAWRDFLGRADCPGGYDTPEFFRCGHGPGRRPFAVLALRDCKVIGVVTGIHTKDQVICGLSSRPQLCIDHRYRTSAVEALLHGLLEESGSQARLIQVFSWHSTPLPEFEKAGFHKKRLQGNVVLDLQIGPEALYKQFHTNRKRNVQAALRNGIVVSEAAPEDFDAYWDVYCCWLKTKRKKILSRATTLAGERIVEQLEAMFRRFVARYQERIIAATTVRFCPGGLIEYTANCSLDEFNGLRANDLLIWRTIEWACKQRFAKYSLGGALSFLRKCGGVIEPIDRYQLDRTFVHRYELKDNVRTTLRRALQLCPDLFHKAVAKALHKFGLHAA